MELIKSNRSPIGMGPSSLEDEIRALYSFVAPRAGRDGIRDEGESPLVPLNAICAKVARSGKMIVYEQPAKSMVARFGHLCKIIFKKIINRVYEALTVDIFVFLEILI